MAGREWNPEKREMVADMVGEMSPMDWRERRQLVNRLVQVAVAALRLRTDPMPAYSSLWAEVIEGVIGKVVGDVIDRLGDAEVVCADQAYVFALSAQAGHRQAARNWFLVHPEHWEGLAAETPTLH